MESASENLTIAKMVSLPRLKVYDQELQEWEEKNSYQNTLPIVDKNTYIGIEVEVENITTFQQSSPYWRMIEDGSLRNNGREFITPPIRAWRIEHALMQLFNVDLNQDIDFSERTSIHIHMNIRTLTVPQLESLIITYILFEKVLFNFIGNNRYNNIFCVPIVETDIGENLLNMITNKSPEVAWQKYTALNLLPIMNKGTIEFRHMSGTKDIERLITWINLLLSLKKFALQKSPEYIWKRINTLNTTSEYRLFAEEVFGEFLPILWNDNFNKAVATCITYVKQFCIRNTFGIQLRQEFRNEFDSNRNASESLTISHIEDVLQRIHQADAQRAMQIIDEWPVERQPRPPLPEDEIEFDEMVDDQVAFDPWLRGIQATNPLRNPPDGINMQFFTGTTAVPPPIVPMPPIRTVARRPTRRNI